MAELEAESQSLQASLVEGREVALSAIERLEARHERFVEHTSRHDDGLWSWFERILLSQNRVDVPKGPLLEAISATLETPQPSGAALYGEAAAIKGLRSRISPSRSRSKERGMVSPPTRSPRRERYEVDDWSSF